MKSLRLRSALFGAGLVGAFGCTPTPRSLPDVPDSPPSRASSAGDAPDATSLSWSYAGELGPESWGSISSEFAACAAPSQSPIDVPLDVLSAPPPNPPALAAEFGALPLEASSNGQLLVLSGASVQGVTFDGKRARLDHIELHAPAEHRLGGTQADLEMVLWLDRGAEPPALFSLLFRVGAENPAIEPLAASLPPRGQFERKLLGSALPLADLVPSGVPVLGYEGSSTTPPCGPAVRLVLGRVLEVSSAQLAKLLSAVPSPSARPVQPLGGRTIRLLSLTRSGAAGAEDQKQVSP